MSCDLRDATRSKLAASKVTTMSVKIHTVAAASLVFLHAADRFAATSKRLDDKTAFDAAAKPEQDRIAGELADAALAAVLTSYLAVESKINELYMEYSIFPDKAHWFEGLDRNLARRLGMAWNAGVIKLNPMDKADMALTIASTTSLDWTQGAPQAFLLLHALRNDLVHHKPIRVEHGKASYESDDRLERKFRWGGCLGDGCARWSLTTAKNFLDLFFGTLNVGHLK
jgi:hypothetical protein